MHLVADLAGWFGPAASGATGSYVPYGPVRALDTRHAIGVSTTTPVAAHGTVMLGLPFESGCVSTCPIPTAWLMTITVTQPKAGGVITAYPSTMTRPGTSNVNFGTGQTISNAAAVSRASDSLLDLYNDSTGTTHLIVDEAGYFIPGA